jgi:ABC-2 type transport system ATP-binding protein
MAKPVLNLVDLRKRYGDFEALRGISLRVDEGESFGLLGPNGAGKSTLLSILACLSDPTSGTVELFGKPLDRGDLSLRPLIGIGTQDLSIYGDMTARENLAFFGKLYGLRGTALKQRVEEVLDLTALRDKADLRAGTYSGGMKRRLNLGVAVMHRPRILFLDEPTTGVDPQSRNHIFEQVKALNAAGMTVIYTSHYMEEVQALCPRIAIVDHGKVIACDTLQGLLSLLDASVKIRVDRTSPELLSRLGAISGVKVTPQAAGPIAISGGELSTILLHVVKVLRETNVELTALETTEPNLERVFLHLTERTLRD